MDTQPKPTQVTKQPEPMTEMTTKHDPPTVSDEIERPSGKVNEDTPSKAWMDYARLSSVHYAASVKD
ncbi:hypothetical protein RSOL_026290, partial [Rhizoctonia solani AG-3 Rhs1AP]